MRMRDRKLFWWIVTVWVAGGVAVWAMDGDSLASIVTFAVALLTMLVAAGGMLWRLGALMDRRRHDAR